MRRMLVPVTMVVAALVVPLMVQAGTGIGTVTVVPFAGSPAPTLNVALLGLLSVALAAAAVLILRKRTVGRSAVALLIAAAALSATVGYTAEFTTIISGAECDQQTTEMYNPFDGGNQFLMSDCAGLIQIIGLSLQCPTGETLAETPPNCDVGTVLDSGETCSLPLCED